MKYVKGQRWELQILWYQLLSLTTYYYPPNVHLVLTNHLTTGNESVNSTRIHGSRCTQCCMHYSSLLLLWWPGVIYHLQSASVTFSETLKYHNSHSRHSIVSTIFNKTELRTHDNSSILQGNCNNNVMLHERCFVFMLTILLTVQNPRMNPSQEWPLSSAGMSIIDMIHDGQRMLYTCVCVWLRA